MLKCFIRIRFKKVIEIIKKIKKITTPIHFHWNNDILIHFHDFQLLSVSHFLLVFLHGNLKIQSTSSDLEPLSNPFHNLISLSLQLTSKPTSHISISQLIQFVRDWLLSKVNLRSYYSKEQCLRSLHQIQGLYFDLGVFSKTSTPLHLSPVTTPMIINANICTR